MKLLGIASTYPFPPNPLPPGEGEFLGPIFYMVSVGHDTIRCEDFRTTWKGYAASQKNLWVRISTWGGREYWGPKSLCDILLWPAPPSSDKGKNMAAKVVDVGIVLGSASDWPQVEPAAVLLKDWGIAF